MATRLEIQQILQQPYDQKRFASSVLKPVFGQAFAYAHAPSKPFVLPTASEQLVINDVVIYGALALEDGTQVTCYEILLQPGVRIEQSKVGIQQYIRKLITTGEAALINFISPKTKDTWRFTLVASDTEINDGDIAEVKTNAKRYTYLVEKERPNRTMAERLEALSLESAITLQSLKKAFSVEAMSKAFFNEYKEHYQNFVEYLTGKRMKKENGKWTEVETGEPHPYLKSLFGGNEKDARDFIKKLMGRIVFLYFVQKKRWLGATTTEYKDGPFDFIAKLFDATEGNENFFPLGLSQLFFEALNKERPNDDWVMPVINRTVKIPYLNGGLFERDEIDELIHKRGDILTFPPGLFSHVEKRDTPSERGFLDFLNAYNFTVYEDSEDDHTVAVDPEMLGHIFENLLEDNKDKGAFYTPKEIVHYMCKESLIEYLKTHLPGEHNAELLEKLVRDQDAGGMDNATLSKVDDRLETVKICDPAIGSGAFPMGLLQEIFTIKEVVSYKLRENFDAARVKEHIISNSIYGVDIERGAVDIARLRFWLSLVVDEDRPKALPNLDYKIVVGDSLLSKFNDEVVEIDWNRVKATESTKPMVENIRNLLMKISTKQRQFFDPSSINKSKLKQEIRDLKLEVLINQISLKKIEYNHTHPEIISIVPSAKEQKHNAERAIKLKSFSTILETLKMLKENHVKPFQHFDWKLDFLEIMNELVSEANAGFDIVIGNPPYLRVQGIRDKSSEYADQLIDRYKSATGSFDLYATFVEKGMGLINHSGVVNFIMPTKWTNAAFGTGLRQVIAEKSAAHKIINFSAYQVFNASTYTGLQWFKFNSDNLLYYELGKDLKSNGELSNYLNSLNQAGETLIPKHKLTSEVWTLTAKETSQIIDKLNLLPRRISDVFDKIFQGLATSKDDVYFLYDCTSSGELVTGLSKYLNEPVTIEKDFTKPLLKGDDVHRYETIKTDKVVVFPYKLANGNAELYKENEIKELFPKAYSYLKRCENVLRDRENGRLKNDSLWYRYIYPKNLTLFCHEKLVAPEISLGGNFSYDEKGEFYSTTKIYGYIKKSGIDESYLFWLGLFNSKLFWYFIRETGYVLRGGYYTFKTNYIFPFPVPGIIPTDISNSIEKTAERIISLKKEENQSDTTEYEKEIDERVYKLYNLSHDDINLIEQ